jgi:hypothetical protein
MAAPDQEGMMREVKSGSAAPQPRSRRPTFDFLGFDRTTGAFL